MQNNLACMLKMCESVHKRRKALHKTILKVINDKSNKVKYRHHMHNPSMGEKNKLDMLLDSCAYILGKK